MKQTRLYFETHQRDAEIAANILETVFEDDGYPVAAFEIDEDTAQWSVSVYTPTEELDDTSKRIHENLGSINSNITLQSEVLAEDGWIEKTLSELKPVRAGRFIVHGSHDKGCAKANDFDILIDAGLAFGTGHHGTTAGCLAMIDRELKRKTFYNALDLGSGTAVLAIAVAKAANIPVLASDIDPVADDVARYNAKTNGVSNLIETLTSTGFTHRRFRDWVPFDLVVANILARPLQSMACDLASHLARGATVILSGLLPHQKSRILATYRTHGLALEHAHYQDGWMTLVLRDMRI